MYSEYYTLRGLVLSEDKILSDEDKERLLNYLDDKEYNFIREEDFVYYGN